MVTLLYVAIFHKKHSATRFGNLLKEILKVIWTFTLIFYDTHNQKLKTSEWETKNKNLPFSTEFTQVFITMDELCIIYCVVNDWDSEPIHVCTSCAWISLAVFPFTCIHKCSFLGHKSYFHNLASLQSKYYWFNAYRWWVFQKRLKTKLKHKKERLKFYHRCNLLLHIFWIDIFKIFTLNE